MHIVTLSNDLNSRRTKTDTGFANTWFARTVYCVLFELSYIYTPFAIASHQQEDSKSKPYKNNSVNNSDKNINNIFDPNE